MIEKKTIVFFCWSLAVCNRVFNRAIYFMAAELLSWTGEEHLADCLGTQPSTCRCPGVEWIGIKRAGCRHERRDAGGKWQLFPRDDEIDGLWGAIADAFQRGRLPSASAAKVTPRLRMRGGHGWVGVYSSSTDVQSVEPLLLALRALGEGFLGELYYKSNEVTLLKVQPTQQSLLDDLIDFGKLSMYSSPALQRTSSSKTVVELFHRHVVQDAAGGGARAYDCTQPAASISRESFRVGRALTMPTPLCMRNPPEMEEVEVEELVELLPPQDAGVVDLALPGGGTVRRTLGLQEDGSYLLLRRYKTTTLVFLAPVSEPG